MLTSRLQEHGRGVWAELGEKARKGWMEKRVQARKIYSDPPPVQRLQAGERFGGRLRVMESKSAEGAGGLSAFKIRKVGRSRPSRPSKD